MAEDEQDIRIVLQSLASCELGRLRKAAFIDNSRGVRAANMRVLGSYAIVYVIKGHGRYQDSNGLELPVRQGDFILLFPDVGHRYGPPGEERWSEFYIVFGGGCSICGASSGCSIPKTRCITSNRSDTGSNGCNRPWK